jgi:hypothetical protein
MRTAKMAALAVEGKHRENTQGHLRYVEILQKITLLTLVAELRENKQGVVLDTWKEGCLALLGRHGEHTQSRL